jgi:hypothetical protein
VARPAALDHGRVFVPTRALEAGAGDENGAALAAALAAAARPLPTTMPCPPTKEPPLEAADVIAKNEAIDGGTAGPAAGAVCRPAAGAAPGVLERGRDLRGLA